MNKKIVINEENFEIYNMLYKIKENNIGCKYRNGEIIETAGMSLIVSSCAIPIIALSSAYYFNFPAEGMAATFFGSLLVASFLPITIYSDYNYMKNIEKFNNDYPEVDIDVPYSELKKELKKYQELSVIPEDIKEQEQKQTNYIKENINNMNLKEKYQALKDEISYIEQLEIQERYQNTDDLDNKVKNKNSLSKYRV